MNENLRRAMGDGDYQDKKNSNPTSQSELSRITSIPLSFPLTDKEVEEFNRLNLKADVYLAKNKEGKPIFRLYESQARSVLWYDRYKGVFAPISCGGGKTGTSLMIAERAWRRGIQKIVLLIPPEIYDQLTTRQGTRESDIAFWRKRVELTYPITGMGNLAGPGARARRARDRKYGLFVVPHSLMSTQDSSELLEKINPGLIIIDEAHRFKNRSAAKTKRLMTYLFKHKPHLVILSGSITDKSVKDYFHFLKPTLDRKSPLPLDYQDMMNWAQVIDTGAEPTEHMKTQLTPLVTWGRKHFANEKYPDSLDGDGKVKPGKPVIDDLKFDVSGIRKAYKLRLNHCPGVVSTADSGVGTTLIIKNNVIERPTNDEIARLNKIEAGVLASVTPNGDPIDHAMNKFSWFYQLSCGFYYRQYWPTPETVGIRKNLTVSKAQEIIEGSQKVHVAHKLYTSALQKWFGESRHRVGLDTPFLVGNSMRKHGAQFVGQKLYNEWMQWKELEKEMGDDLIERDSEPVRISDYKIDAAVKWAVKLKQDSKHAGAIIWYYYNEIGVWTTEKLEKALNELGMRGQVVHCPAGDEYNRVIIDPKNATKIVVASLKAHGTGKNLQHFQDQWFLQWPRNCGEAEQVLARTHRPGQKADELVVNLSNSSEFDHRNFAACIRDATYVQQSTGARQKLLMAQYDPIPPMFPAESLNELGFGVSGLDTDGEDLLHEKFG